MRLSLRDHRNVALIDKKEFRDVLVVTSEGNSTSIW